MRNRFIYIFVLVVSAFFLEGFAWQGAIWQRTGNGITESDVNFISVRHNDLSSIYAGTKRALYFSKGPKENFQEIFRLQPNDQSINDVHFAQTKIPLIYVATNSGLYQGRQDSQDWKKIFSDKDALSKQCLAVQIDDQRIYLGTLKGLRLKNHSSQVWMRAKGVLGQYAIFLIESDKDYIYAATSREIYRLRKDNLETKKIFAMNAFGDEIIDTELLGETGVDELSNIKAIRVMNGMISKLVIATTNGIYQSADQGEHWARIPSDGLPLERITSLLFWKDIQGPSNAFPRLVVGTKKGVFSFNGQIWSSLYKGMISNKINGLALDRAENIYSATDQGVFFISQTKAVSSGNLPLDVDYTEIKRRLAREPSVQEIQSLAIEYAEVAPEKISEWRRLARKKAWLPDVSIGIDSSWDRSISDSIYGSYTGGGQHYIAPDDKTAGRDFGWDVSLSWDLSDLIWSTDQTTIDSRSKLMVELRADILDQITRLYFERRRIQVELLASVQSLEPQMIVDKKMRIEELTALIDALTGGEFSRKIKTKSPSHQDTTSPDN